MDEENPEKKFAELMATIGSSTLAQIFSAVEPIRRKRLQEIADLDQQIVVKRQEKTALEHDVTELANSIANLGAEYLRLKEQRRKFVLGEDLSA